MLKIKQDRVGDWFSTYQEMGEFIGVRFGKINPPDTKLHWYYMPHNQGDAVGSFSTLLKNEGYCLSPPPELKIKEKPAWSQILKILGSHLFTKTHKPHEWRNLKRGKLRDILINPPKTVVWKIFSKEQTEKMTVQAKKQGASLNSFLVSTFTKALSEDFKDKECPMTWIIPVNMRGGILMQTDQANCSSFIDIETSIKDSAKDVHKKIKEGFENNIHWVTWYVLHITSMVGAWVRKIILQIQRNLKHQRMGTFSNIGAWNPTPPESLENCDWVFCPTVFSNQLLGIGCLTFRGKLSLSLQAHPTLTKDPNVTAQWLKKWEEEIFG